EAAAAPAAGTFAAPADADVAFAPEVPAEQAALDAAFAADAGAEPPADAFVMADTAAPAASPLPNIDPVLYDIFTSEVAAHLAVMDAFVSEAERASVPASEPLLRAVHTLNGAVAMVDVPVITHVLAPLENYIKRLCAGALAPDAAGLAAMAETGTLVRAVISALDRGDAQLPDSNDLAWRIAHLRDALPEPQLMHPLFTRGDEAAWAAEADTIAAADTTAEGEALAADEAGQEQVPVETNWLDGAWDAGGADAAVAAEADLAADAGSATPEFAAATADDEERVIAELYAAAGEPVPTDAAAALAPIDAEAADGEAMASADRADEQAASVEEIVLGGDEILAVDIPLDDDAAAPAEPVAAAEDETQPETASEIQAEADAEAEAAVFVPANEPIESIEISEPALSTEIIDFAEIPAAANFDEPRTSVEQPAPVAPAPMPAETLASLAEAPPLADDPQPDGRLELGEMDEDLLEIFVQEGADILDHSDSLMANLRLSPQDRELVGGLQRDLHTLKGGARMAGLAPIGDLSHAMESLLDAISENRRLMDRVTVESLERGFDRLHALVQRVSKRQAIAMPVNAIER
ncbi:MAG TPA: Hpt domain-containing protein, partial [Thermomicrobiales bacterium]|nr:Hpt domain-containing protein [Thermomicrobiales bacterium]